MKEETCLKNPNNSSYIDIFLANRYKRFQNTITVFTGKPLQITFKDYKSFKQFQFKKDLHNYISLVKVQDNIAPLKNGLKILTLNTDQLKTLQLIEK